MTQTVAVTGGSGKLGRDLPRGEVAAATYCTSMPRRSQLVTAGTMVRLIRILGSTPLVSGLLVMTVTRSRSGTT
jgi:hypothetical protein